MQTIDTLLRKRLVICVGAGGVGKTTTAAALAMAAATRGRRAAVITVDPARRLKDALGVDEISGEPHSVAVAGACFDALALDTKRTFDGIIERFAPSAEIAARILNNRLYQELSNEFSGSAEYMAMEKLYELTGNRRYQTLVVDTPPGAHMHDLLAAPSRLANLLASRAVGLLQAPASLLSAEGSRLGRGTLGLLLRVLRRWTGLDLLTDLADFASAFEHLAEGFGERAAEVDRLLHSRRTAFVLVTTLEPHAVATAIDFHRELREERFPIAGVIANRLFAFPRLRDAKNAVGRWPPALRRKLLQNYAELHELAQRDRRAMRQLHERTALPLIAAIPAVAEPPTSLPALSRFTALLAGSGR
jgi:anion-transporting  ArsA/GET3 family ATPase